MTETAKKLSVMIERLEGLMGAQDDFGQDFVQPSALRDVPSFTSDKASDRRVVDYAELVGRPGRDWDGAQ